MSSALRAEAILDRGELPGGAPRVGAAGEEHRGRLLDERDGQQARARDTGQLCGKWRRRANHHAHPGGSALDAV